MKYKQQQMNKTILQMNKQQTEGGKEEKNQLKQTLFCLDSIRLKKKRIVHKYSSYICFSQGYESATLQRPSVCTSVEQIGKYITDNKTKVSHCQEVQIKKVRRLKQTLKLWTGTSKHHYELKVCKGERVKRKIHACVSVVHIFPSSIC